MQANELREQRIKDVFPLVVEASSYFCGGLSAPCSDGCECWHISARIVDKLFGEET